MSRLRGILLAVASIGGAACTLPSTHRLSADAIAPETTPEAAAPADVPTDALTDVSSDVLTDTPTDALTDVSSDVPSDAPIDAPIDAVVDAPVAVDTFADVAPDADVRDAVEAGPMPCTSPLNRAFEVSAGSGFTCAVMSDGTGRCWGNNSANQLGNGGGVGGPVPVRISPARSGDALEHVVAGPNAACATYASLDTRCWGSNDGGRLGLGDAMNAALPRLTAPPARLQSVWLGTSHACGVESAAGALLCWGSNEGGLLGEGADAPARLAPDDMHPLAIGVALGGAGALYSCTVLSSGLVTCWGSGGPWLGVGSTEGPQRPRAIEELASVTDLAVGPTHACALSGENVYCWGQNVSGEVGITPPSAETRPRQVVGVTGVRALAVGGHTSCALLRTGSVRCWGSHSFGQLGDGTPPSSAGHPEPVTVMGITDAMQISVGENHACAVLRTGCVRCWGNNSDGQLGVATGGASSAVPVGVEGLE